MTYKVCVQFSSSFQVEIVYTTFAVISAMEFLCFPSCENCENNST